MSHNLVTNVMQPGDGETSYAKNSGIQKIVISRTLPMLNDTLEELLDDPHLGSQKCYKLVDFGCSSGSNAIWCMTQIADKIENVCRKKKPDVVPEFVGYLNDLPENDFNNLFKFLPDSHGDDQNGKAKARLFMYAVPGSFYERLFPENSLHFAHSSYSVHWLSQIPEGLGSENKENIYLAEESSPKVLEVYTKQFQRDFSTFLRLRAEEMIQGGRMVLSFLGRSSENSYGDGAWLTLVSKSLLDMVNEGLVRQEDLYSFNMAHYEPCKSEVHAVVEKEGSFSLDMFEVFDVPWGANKSSNDEWEDPLKSGKLVAHSVRAVLESMLTTHFGNSIIDDLFERYAKKVDDHMSAMHKSVYVTIVISLKRK